MQEVVIFLRNIEGGVTTYVRNFLNFYPGNDITFKIVLLTDNENGVDRVTNDFKANEIIIFNYNIYENNYYFLKRLSKTIKSPTAIIWANERTELAIVNLFRLPNKVINIMHGDSPYYYNNVIQYSSIVNGFIATSEWINNRTTELVDKVHACSVVRKIFAPVRQIEMGIEDERRICKIIYVGRINESKGCQHIVGICRVLDKMGVPYEMTLVGSGELIPIINNAKVDLKGKIFFPGFLSSNEVSELLRQHHIFLFPSYSEAVGLAVVEAMKAGLVPVTSDLPSGIPEFVKNYETGFRVEVGNEKAFAERIGFLFSNIDIRKSMSVAANKLANDLFEPRTQSEKIVQFLKHLYENDFKRNYFNYKANSLLDTKIIPNRVSILFRKLRNINTKNINF